MIHFSLRLKLKQEENRISLIVPKPKIANEYFTEEEMIKFKKPKKVRKVLRKKNKIVNNSEMSSFGDLDLSSVHGSRKSRTIEQMEEREIKTEIKDV